MLKNDKYKKARGGWSRMLDIRCSHCGQHVCNYQKDGPGVLKRMYIDRMDGFDKEGKELTCSACSTVLGVKIIYQKEDRVAYRLFVGSVSKKIVKSKP